MWQIIDDHWIWLRGADARGYGMLQPPVVERACKLHKRLWEDRNGKLGEGEFLKQMCGVFRCHNPEHYCIIYSKLEGSPNKGGSPQDLEAFRRAAAIRELERAQAERERLGQPMPRRVQQRWRHWGLPLPDSVLHWS